MLTALKSPEMASPADDGALARTGTDPSRLAARFGVVLRWNVRRGQLLLLELSDELDGVDARAVVFVVAVVVGVVAAVVEAVVAAVVAGVVVVVVAAVVAAVAAAVVADAEEGVELAHM